MTSWLRSATRRLALSSSSSTCSPASPCAGMSSCRSLYSRGTTAAVCRTDPPARRSHPGAVGLADRMNHRPDGALRRPAAAGGDCPGLDQRAGPDPGRRAHRQPGFPHRGRDHEPAPRPEPGSAGLTLVIVTHDPTIAAQTQRVIRLRDGLIENG